MCHTYMLICNIQGAAKQSQIFAIFRNDVINKKFYALKILKIVILVTQDPPCDKTTVIFSVHFFFHLDPIQDHCEISVLKAWIRRINSAKLFSESHILKSN